MGIREKLLGWRTGNREERNRTSPQKHDTAVLFETMTDTQLLAALSQRIAPAIRALNERQVVEGLDGPARTLYLLNAFDREIRGGGLCQFFVNSSRALAPWIPDALLQIEASPYAQLYTDFTRRHQIDLSDLDSFAIRNLKEYEGQAARYPFDDFDRPFYDLEQVRPLASYLADYARKHRSEF
ncbi:DMP19 family protein [Clostridiaceae bacterium HFYG-1003]|nr:DMP19 family protein [Clostridiaceae bacterium HFYG-1003]